MPHVCVRYLYFVCNAPERHTERLSETEIENDAMSCDNVWNRSLVIMPCRANSIIINWLRVHQIEEHYAQRTTDSRSNRSIYHYCIYWRRRKESQTLAMHPVSQSVSEAVVCRSVCSSREYVAHTRCVCCLVRLPKHYVIGDLSTHHQTRHWCRDSFVLLLLLLLIFILPIAHKYRLHLRMTND